jgi:hypothetical protein
MACLLSLFGSKTYLSENRSKLIVKNITDISSAPQELNFLNIPKILKIEPLPNFLKQTRKKIVISDDLFLYAPFNSKGGNIETQDRYLNYEVGQII